MDFTVCAILTPALPPTSLWSGHPTGLCECTPSLASASWNNVMWQSHLKCVSTPSQASNSWNNVTWLGLLGCMYSKSHFSFLKQCHMIGCSCMFQFSETMSSDWMFLHVRTPSHVSAFWNNGMWLGHLVCMHSKSHFSFLKQCHVIRSLCVYALQVMLQLPETMSCDWVTLRVTLQVMHMTGSPCVYARQVTLQVHKTMSGDWVILCVCMPSHTSVSWNNATWLGHPVCVHPIRGFSFLKQGVSFQIKHTRNMLSQNSALIH